MKKLLCILLTVTLVVGMAVSASASVIIVPGGPGPVVSPVVTSGIRGINESDSIDALADFEVTINNDKRNVMSLDDLSDLEVAPGDVIRIPLSGSLFLDSSGNPFGSNQAVSLSALHTGNITVRTSFSRGSGSYIASLGGNKNGSYIQIEFDSEIFLTAQRFSSSIYLARNGSRKQPTRIAVSGILQTPRQELEWGDDYVDISDGSAVYARTAIRDVELYLGDYCSITRSLARGVTYAGIATTDDINEEDIAILNKHPSIQYLYKLRTVGLKTTGNIVTFDLNRKYYVYDSNGIYIGTSDKPLPYWTRYYLSTKKYESIKVK